MVLVAVVTVLGLVAPSLMGAPAAGAGAGARSTSLHAAGAAPAVSGTPPYIEYFDLSPAEFNLGGYDYIESGAFTYDIGSAGFSYAGLPPGCTNTGSTFFFCQPTAAGTYNITLTVTDSLTSLTSTSQRTMIVIPVLNGTFFTVNPSVIPNLDYANAACYAYDSAPFYQNFCAPEAETPTLLPLGNGALGLSSELYTNSTASTCPGASLVAKGQVGFSVSTNNGTSFGPAALIANDTSCAYWNSIEPSFAVSGPNVYGAFIEENFSNTSVNYGNRAGDALAFVNSSNNGTNFSAVQTIDPSGNLARPEMAALGSSIYIVYENISNSTSPIGGGVLPISLELIASTNGGLTWSSPVTLPGLGASQGYNAMSPSIAVSASGTVAVAYATDRTCTYLNLTGCGTWSDSIVVTTSTDHGATWGTPSVVASGAGESTCYTGGCLPFFFESTPQTAIAFDPTGSDLYVAYVAPYDQGLGANALNYNHTGVFAAVSSNGGTSWTPDAVVAPVGATAVRSFNPGLGVSSQGVFLTYLQANESSGYFGLANSLSQWIVTGAAGPTLTWNEPTIIDVQSFSATGGSVNTTRTSFSGYSSSVAFNPAGNPWVAFALPGSPTTTVSSSPTYYYVNSTFPTSLAVASLAIAGAANTVVVNFTALGLPAGTPWIFYINGVSYPLTDPSVILMNIPLGATMLVGAYYNPTGEWTIVQTYFNATTTSFYYNQTYTFSFSVWVGMEFNFFPGNLGYWWLNGDFELNVDVVSVPNYQFIDAYWDVYEYFICTPVCHLTIENEVFYDTSLGFSYQDCIGYLCNWTSPWYFPLGAVITLAIQDYEFAGLPAVYVTGTGVGSYTGPIGETLVCGYYIGNYCEYYYYVLGSGEIATNGPIQETIWLGDAPEDLASNVTFASTGLPSGSTFHATFNGSVLSGTPASPSVVTDVAPGAYTVSNVWATNATAPGWEYFGAPVGPNPFVPPLDTSVTLAFDASVNVSAPAGVVTFHAPAIAAGTTWSLTFNGTTYTSHTPWINLTTRPGTFAWSAGNAVAPSGTAGYVPTTRSGNVSVLPGSTYTIGYTPAYEVLVAASAGGLVSVNHGSLQSSEKQFWAAGTQLTLSETPSSGYAFAGWTGTGAGSYNGTSSSEPITVSGPIVETASYLPLPGARFNLTFVESGVPTGAWWTVDLNGIGYSSDVPSMTVSGLNSWTSGIQGHYNLTVPTAYANGTSLTRYVPVLYPGVVGANGTLTAPVDVVYVPEEQVSLTLTGEGTVSSTYNKAPTGTSVWAVQGSSVEITATAYPGWAFSGWQGTGSGSYTGPNATYDVTANGPIGEVALFTQVVVAPTLTYTVTFSLSTPLAAGTSWGVTLGGVGYSTTASTLVISDVTATTYAMQVNTATAPSGLVQYRSTSSDPVALTVKSNTTLTVGYDPYYFVGVSASVGGTVSPGSEWYASGSVLYLVATANASDSFASWVGSGTGSYTGSNATASVIVTGPITEVATFHSSIVGAAAASIWSNPATWIGLGVAALVVGIAVGAVVTWLGNRGAPTGSRPQGNLRATSPPPKGGSP